MKLTEINRNRTAYFQAWCAWMDYTSAIAPQSLASWYARRIARFRFSRPSVFDSLGVWHKSRPSLLDNLFPSSTPCGLRTWSKCVVAQLSLRLYQGKPRNSTLSLEGQAIHWTCLWQGRWFSGQTGTCEFDEVGFWSPFCFVKSGPWHCYCTLERLEHCQIEDSLAHQTDSGVLEESSMVNLADWRVLDPEGTLSDIVWSWESGAGFPTYYYYIIVNWNCER